MLKIGNSQNGRTALLEQRLPQRLFSRSVPVKATTIHHLMESRLFLCISTWIYAASLMYFLSYYLAAEAAIYKYTYGVFAPNEIISCMLAFAIVSSVLPKSIDRPSSLFLISVHFFIFVPAAIALIGLDRMPQHSNDEFDILLLITMTLGFVCANLLVSRYDWKPDERESSMSLLYVLMIVWTIALLALIQLYGTIMSFSSLETIYLQRDAGSAKGVFEGYLQTYFGYVISPSVLTIGLSKKRLLPIVMGFVGAVVLYMITAEKSAICYPFVMVCLYATLNSKWRGIANTGILGLLLAIISFTSAYFYKTVYPAYFLAVYFISRACMVPGIMVVFYSEYFEQNGYTFWSQTRGINLLIEPPAGYASNPRWPSLGHLVGEEYMGLRTLNANASFIASDGIASFGPLGALICFPLLACFLIYLDRYASGTTRPFAITLILPLAMTITNGSLFTAMTSFGGFAFIIAFRFLFKSQNAITNATHSTDFDAKKWHLF